MSDPAKRRANYQDVLDAPAPVTAQVVDGVLHTSPRPSIPHTATASSLGMNLGGLFQFGSGGGPGGWVILFEPELHLGAEPDIVVPDLAGWRRERLPMLPAEPFLTLHPDWLCEVLSPSTQAFDRVQKMEVYRREGVPHVWLVDPRARTLEAYLLKENQWVRTHSLHGNVAARIEPFDAVELDLSVLWV